MNTVEKLNYSNERVIAIHCTRVGIDRNVAIERFNELISYLHTASISNAATPLSQDVDEMWHDFLLCSRDYREFCMTYLGVFIDHEPLTADTNIHQTLDCADSALCVPTKPISGLHIAGEQKSALYVPTKQYDLIN